MFGSHDSELVDTSAEYVERSVYLTVYLLLQSGSHLFVAGSALISDYRRIFLCLLLIVRGHKREGDIKSANQDQKDGNGADKPFVLHVLLFYCVY